MQGDRVAIAGPFRESWLCAAGMLARRVRARHAQSMNQPISSGAPSVAPREPHWILCDLETPGLDPSAGQPLEIGLIAVNRKLEPVAHWASPIKPFHGDWFSRLDPYIVEMHSNSGLIGELRGPRSHMLLEAGGLPTLQEAEAVAVAFVTQFGHPPVTWRDGTVRGQAILAGANVGKFECAHWIPVHFPRVAALLSHRSLDTNFTFLAEQFLGGGPTEKTETRHRALDDCVQALNGLRRFFGLPAWAGAVP